jgi:Xaa-Pro aminopeptidase
MTTEQDAPLNFSLAERDRRWQAIRALMAERGLDVLVATGNTASYNHHSADARYITQIGGPEVEVHAILPLNGAVTAITRGKSAWIDDARPFHRREADGIVERLKELGADGKRIGVSGLKGLIRSPYGIVNFTVMEKLRENFPRATFVSATDLMQEVRSIKSEEEIVFIKKAEAIAEAACAALVQAAKSGMKDCAVYARMVGAEIEAGGELPFMLAWFAGEAGKPYKRYTQASPDRVIADGDLIYCQIEGRWRGYCAQIDQSITIGKVPAEMKPMYEAHVEAFNATLSAMKPGATYGDLFRACAATSTGKKYEAKLMLHGRGLGEDWPLAGPRSKPELLERELRENNVFDVKPGIEIDGRDLWGRFGDSVVVTASGAKRLGARSPDYINLGG